MFLAFFQGAGNPRIKTLGLKVTWLLLLLSKTSIFKFFDHPQKSCLMFYPLLPSFIYKKCWFSCSVIYQVRRFFIDNLFIYNIVKQFFGFSPLPPVRFERFFINWSSWFSSTISYWVRKFFTKLPTKLSITTFIYLTEFVFKKKSNYNIINHDLVINQSCEFSLVLTKIFIFAKTLWSNLLIHSHWLFLINIINPIILSSDI